MKKIELLSLFEFIIINGLCDVYLLNLDSFNGKSLNIKLKNFYNLLNSIYNQYKTSELRLFRSDNHKAFIIKDNLVYIDKNYNQNFIDEIKKLYLNIKNKEKKINVEDYALIQSMHNIRKNYSYFLYLTPIINNPEIIFINNEKIEYNQQNINIFENLIIIENIENFFRYKEFINLNIFNFIPNLNNSIILLGNGKQINNSLLTPFLEKFNTLHCFFDYDSTGSYMFDQLIHKNKINYIPKKEILLNIINLIEKNKKLLNQEPKFELYNSNLEFIKLYNDIINKKDNKKFITIEQEILLHKDIK